MAWAATGVTHPDSSLEALLAVLLVGVGALLHALREGSTV